MAPGHGFQKTEEVEQRTRRAKRSTWSGSQKL